MRSGRPSRKCCPSGLWHWGRQPYRRPASDLRRRTGHVEAFTPKFVKKYANVAEVCTNAYKDYIDEVHSGTFPSKDHFYTMKEGEVETFEAAVAKLKVKK